MAGRPSASVRDRRERDRRERDHRDTEPTLHFDWEEGLFRAVRGVIRQLRPGDAGTPGEAAAMLVEQADALRVLAGVVSGADLRVRMARGVGGLRGRDVLLPAVVELAPDSETNRSVYVVRTVLAATMYRLALEGAEPVVEAGDPLLGWLRRCRCAVEAAQRELPRFAELHAGVVLRERAARPAPDRLRGRARFEEQARQAALAGGAPWDDAALRRALAATRSRRDSSPEILAWGAPIEVLANQEGAEAADDAVGEMQGREEDAGAVDELRVLLLDEKDARELPVHVFEKVEMLDDWQGGVKRMDGADDLDDHLEALEELDLKDLIRGGEQAQALLRADFALDIDIPDVSRIAPGEVGIPYDEWDRRKRCYRADWTTVYPTPVAGRAPAWGAEVRARRRRLIEDLTSRLVFRRQQLRPQTRQLDGEEVDVDHLVDELSAIAAGHGGDPRLYVRMARQQRDVATAVLLDMSLSSDSWVDDRRVLDVAREAVLVLGEVTDALGDRLRVIGFASHTRNQVRAFDVLDWGEPWARGRDRLGVLRPQGYTRIGPAIRHASAELRRVDARERLLLIVSDGKPTDYDRYEGAYGVSDVRQAVREAVRDGVHVHALAIEAIARDYLPQLVGPGAWHLLPRADDLAEVLTTIYGRLTG